MTLDMPDKDAVDLSIIVCAFNMGRELPRTLYSLSPAYQRHVDGLAYEVIVLDNGSTPAVDERALQDIFPGVRVVRPDVISISPAAAINALADQLRGRLIGLWIDGARIATPGIIHHAMEAWRTDPAKVIGTLAFHLGRDVQMRSVFEGYDAAAEDALLHSINWRQDGYRLFDISVLAGSSANGWFGCISESNGLFLDRALWQELGGLDQRFACLGGGFVNLDFWERAIQASGGSPWMILGEGTFHQVHGGAATNGTADDRTVMRDEYTALHGRPFVRPSYSARYVGALDAKRFKAGHSEPVEKYRKAHMVRGRQFRMDLPQATIAGIQKGTLRTRYKGLRLAKNPFDLALYANALGSVRPATIIEVGTSEGGSAVWLADQCLALGLDDTQILTIDITPPLLDVPNITCFPGDAYAPETTFPLTAIADAPHPWLVIEDSAHTLEATLRVLDFFDARLITGDMIVVEDGVVADMDGDQYRQFKDGPNRAVAAFLGRVGDRYSIDTALCDFYGHNLTYAPNAWLHRT
ncbi:CmcI family methyltransferase [Sphingobium sp. WCS2017Hpa-17]|uniref:CmcI family methyltransferase n=1 Tax=Sphingobium sp. WCS2017Hpa-17 TaxID=3073638 RepID=UPI00288B8133|nr:CmcI family methyltransferase [Sphingobium sp. WCS2017Hpa-17]